MLPVYELFHLLAGVHATAACQTQAGYNLLIISISKNHHHQKVPHFCVFREHLQAIADKTLSPL